MEIQKSYKISSLEIKNYKCFEDITFTDFNENNLIVFDGPNGYGKTTAFDAIEIALTNTPRRYRDINIDARNSYEDSPIHKRQDLPIEISLKLKKEGEENTIDIKRVIEKPSINRSQNNNIRNIFNTSNLFINGKKSTEIELEDILEFSDLSKLFSILNYVEQDENTFFIKESPKGRYKALSSLLGAEKEIGELEKVKKFEWKLSELIKDNINQIEEIQNNTQSLLQIEEDVRYNRLVENIEIIWDNENIENVETEIHQRFLEELDRIKYLLENKGILKDVVFLNSINDFNNNDFLGNYTKFYWGIQNYEVLEQENTQKQNYTSLIKKNIILIGFIDSLNYDSLVKEEYINLIEEKENIGIDVNEFKQNLDSAILLKSSLTLENQILNDLKNKRDALIKLIEKHNHEGGEVKINLNEGQCPMCGFSWESTEKLINEIKKTEDEIFSEYNESNKVFEELKNIINVEFLEPLKKYLVEENEKLNTKINLLIDQEYFSLLKDYRYKLNEDVKKFLNLFEIEDQKILINIVDKRVVENREQTKESIIAIIEEKTPKINEDILIPQLTHDYEYYFQKDLTKLDSISLEKIEQKKKYINNQFYNSINARLSDLNKKKDQFIQLRNKIQEIKNIIDEEIKNYTKNIVDTVTIPFYIFTGKILQHHNLGTGLLLDLNVDNRDPQFRIRPIGTDQEVSYTVSSGQLSATVIALMLVLNKVYNKSKLGIILIDDPLQTLDEINTHSLIELLKYNFSDQQVILSTHEDRYSKFIRYKYDKFKLSNTNISMKDII